jgi:hypothetical protein
MKLLRTLGLVLCLASSLTNYSKAEIVSVPILNGQFTVNVMTGADAYQLQEIKNNPAAIRRSISDDGNVNVPLDFTFPYFGQNFTNSWMYSNGAVSFKSGNAPGGFCCSGLNLTTERNTGYNYSLLPLQTDLIGTTNNNFYTLSTKTSMTYGWYGVNEYGSGNKSSFEVKIDNTGLVDFRFGQALVTNHPVTIGMTGDLSKGEYYTYFNGGSINRSNFGFNGIFGTGQDPCTSDPMANTSCPGYAAAYLSYQCNISALYDISCPGYATAYFNQQCGISALYNVACPGYAAAYLTQQCNANQLYSTACPGYAAAYLTQQCNITQLYSTSCPGYNTAYAQKLVLEAQAKQTTADSTKTEAAKADASPPGAPPPPPPGAPVQDNTSAKADVKLDLGGATISATGEIKPSDGIPDAARPPAPPEIASGPGPGQGPSNSASPSLPPPPGAPAGFAERQPDAQQDRRAGSSVNALSIARNAVATTEALARTVASESSKMSYSENANPLDGIGLSLEKTGIKLNIPGLSFGGQTITYQAEASTANTSFYNSSNTTTLSNTNNIGSGSGIVVASVQEQKYTPRQENQNISQGMELPTVPQQLASSHFENMQSSITALQEQRIESNETVKNKGDVSELAGGIDLNKLTAIPAGYNTYMTVTLKDSPFYEIKEVYKNQVNVDNVRLLRSLGSDRLHQEMVNQQYKIGR